MKPIPENTDLRLLAAAPQLLSVAKLFLRGIRSGHIKCQPFMDMSNPEAESFDFISPAKELEKVIALATP